MALQKTIDLSGLTATDAYHRVDRVVVEHKQSVYCVVRSYVDAQHAADRVALPLERSYAFPWPKDEAGNLLAVPNASAFCYEQLKAEGGPLAGATDL